MAVDPASGMDLDQLYLDKDGAKDVVSGFRELAGKLEAIRNKFSGVESDLGMGDCSEGRSWNTKMTHAHDAVHQKLTDYIRRANDFADKAEAAQAAIDKRDSLNADQFTAVDGSQAYPPLNQ
ncbi:hypothetical protein [Mycobacteroides abscessus]|uniref:hypothetical protein n=1 Tax=Mycobacteroides abscessus TaxID=36809 RepID=UPI000C25C418|nr:hypothetical protein [Mycobacteroides abscessus]